MTPIKPYTKSIDMMLSPFGGEYNITTKPKKGLSVKDFEIKNSFQNYANSNRFMSKDVWRPQDLYQNNDISIYSNKLRPKLPKSNYFTNRAQYLRQPLVADYAPDSDKIFLMIKTGSTVLWNRLPIHLMTTLTKVPYFGLYSDMATSVGGHEVIDILANVTEKTKNVRDFKLYRRLQKLRKRNGIFDPAIADLKGGWKLDKYKNIPMLAHALKVAPKSVDWFVFIDADTYLLVDNMINYLMTLNARDKLYIGSWVHTDEVDFAHGGSGVAISRGALESSLGEHPDWEHTLEDDTSHNCCGDIMVAEMLKKANIIIAPSAVDKYPYAGKRFQGEPLFGLEASNETWCQPVFTFHHIKPFEVEILWEYERVIGPERKKFITYYDIYRDFYLPYIKPVMPDWNNLVKEKKFSKDDDQKKFKRGKESNSNDEEKEEDETKYSDRPWYSQENCEKECYKWEECLSWRYIPKVKYCGLGKMFKFGHPQLQMINVSHWPEEKNWDNTGIVSGFLISRIREMRSHQKCDALYNLDVDSFKELEYEGWHVDKEKKESNAT